MKLEEALEKFKEMGGTVFVCAKGGKSFDEIKKEIEASSGGGAVAGFAIGFAVGPEGGWSDREEMYFKRHSLTQISLGKNVLRAETAAVAVMALAKVS